MNNINLEKKITRGIVSYISSIEHDRLGKRITIRFLKSATENYVDRVLTFFDVESLSEQEFEDDDIENTIDSLISLSQYFEEGSVRYVINTELREMIFQTKEKPRIEEVIQKAI